MRYHPSQPDEFVPTSLQPGGEKEDFSHAVTVLSETRQRLQQREPDVNRRALEYARRARPTPPRLPAEAESASCLTLLGESLLVLPDDPTPFPAKARGWLNRVVGPDPAALEGWQLWAEGLLPAGRAELACGDYLLFARRATQTGALLRRAEGARRLEPAVEELTRAACQRFAATLSNEERDALTPEGSQALADRVQGFWRQLTVLWKLGSEAEIRLNLARFWAEQFAPCFEASAAHWQALAASLGAAAADTLPRPLHAVLVEQLEPLHQGAGRMSFCGLWFRRLAEMAPGLDADARESGLPGPWRPLVGDQLGAWFAAAADAASLGPAAGDATDPALSGVWRAVQREPVYHGLSADALGQFAGRLLARARPVGERHWLDQLARQFARLGEALRSAERRSAQRERTDRAVREAAGNLREARDVFRAHNFLEEELRLLAEGASTCAQLGVDAPRRHRLFQRWFTDFYALRRGHQDIWRHGPTLVKALQTRLRQSGPDGRPTGVGTDPEQGLLHPAAAELLDEVPGLQERGAWAALAWSELERLDWPEAAAGSPAGSAEDPPAVGALLQDLVVELVRAGAYRAPAAVALGWYEARAFRTARDHERLGSRVGAAVSRLKGSGGALGHPAYLPAVAELAAELDLVGAGAELWRRTPELARQAAAEIYRRHGAHAAPATSPEQVESCARDLGLTWERLATAWRRAWPEEEAAAWVGDWWEAVVRPHLARCPASLFPVTDQVSGEILAEALGPRFGPRAAAILGSLYRQPPPLPATAAPPGAEAAPPAAAAGGTHHGEPAEESFGALPFPAPRWENLRRDPATGLAAQSELAHEFFLETVGLAWQRATAGGGGGGERPAAAPAPAEVANWAAGLRDGYGAYQWSGCLDGPTTAWWRGQARRAGLKHETLERFLRHLMRGIDDERFSLCGSLQMLAYLQELVEFHRRSAAGHALRLQANELAARSADGLRRHGVMISRQALRELLRTWADALGTLPLPGAAWHLHRYLVERLSPQLADWTPEAWRALWQNLSGHAAETLEPAVSAELERWCEPLAAAGAALIQGGAIVRHLEASAEPLFSPDPGEEAEWRRTLGAVVALAQLQAVGGPGADRLPLLRAVACESLPLLRRPEFAEQTAALSGALRDWFPDLDLRGVQAAIEELRRRWLGWRQFDDLHHQLGDWCAQAVARTPALGALAPRHAEGEGAPQLHVVALVLARAALEGGGLLGATNAWGVPRALGLMSGRFLASLAKLTASELERVSQVYHGLLSPWPALGPDVDQRLYQLHRIATNLGRFSVLWEREWNVAPIYPRRNLFGFSPTAPTGWPSEDAAPMAGWKWIARRLALDTWRQRFGAPVHPAGSALAWCRTEVLSRTYPGLVGRDHLAYLAGFVGTVTAAGDEASEMDAGARALHEALAGALLATKLEALRPRLARESVAALRAELPPDLPPQAEEQLHFEALLAVRLFVDALGQTPEPAVVPLSSSSSAVAGSNGAETTALQRWRRHHAGTADRETGWTAQGLLETVRRVAVTQHLDKEEAALLATVWARLN